MSQGTHWRCLVADDDVLVRTVIRVALEDRGITVVEASSGATAIAVADSVDFAVIDARMPGLSLAETIAGLRANRALPLLVVSGGAPASRLPADVAFMLKPIELEPFLAAVDRLTTAAAVSAGTDIRT